MPLTDFNYIGPKSTWPPLSEDARIRAYEDNTRLYRGDFTLLRRGAPLQSQLRFQAVDAPPQERITVNLFRNVIKLWRDMMFSTPPVFDHEGGLDARLPEVVPSLLAASRSVLGSALRTGAGVYIIRNPGTVESVDGRYWFPVTAPEDLSEVRGHVIAYPFYSNPEGRTGTPTPRGTGRAQTGQNPDRIQFYRFVRADDGSWGCDRATFRYEATTIGDQLTEWEPVPCGPFPVIPVVLEGEDIYGESIFEDMKAHVSEINDRETKLSLSLDKHADPHLAVPEGSLAVDASGRAQLNEDGMAIFVPEGGATPQYVVWEAQYDAHVAAIARAERRAYAMAAVSNIIAPVGAQEGNIRAPAIPSGSALRRLALPTVQRIRNYRITFGEAMQMAIVSALGEGDPGLIKVNWPPVLDDAAPDDTGELVELVHAGLVDPEDAIQAVNRVPQRQAAAIAGRAVQRSSQRAREAAQGANSSD